MVGNHHFPSIYNWLTLGFQEVKGQVSVFFCAQHDEIMTLCWPLNWRGGNLPILKGFGGCLDVPLEVSKWLVSGL